MPSAFPGMDPFLEDPEEDPEIFPDLHDSLITYLRESLQAQLPPPYFAVIGRRLWVEVSRRPGGPDVNVSRDPKARASEPTSGGVAVEAPPVAEPVVIHVPHDEIRETFIDIYSGRSPDKRLITSIEVLSPINKTPGEHGRGLYLRKQAEMLSGRINLVEIDLLRGGEHVTAVPLDRLLEEAGPFDYHVCIHRSEDWENFLVYPIRLEQKLPTFPIPLLPKDAEISVDLQAIFDHCYDAGPYRREVRYDAAIPSPPLSAGRNDWVRQRLNVGGGAN